MWFGYCLLSCPSFFRLFIVTVNMYRMKRIWQTLPVHHRCWSFYRCQQITRLSTTVEHFLHTNKLARPTVICCVEYTGLTQLDLNTGLTSLRAATARRSRFVQPVISTPCRACQGFCAPSGWGGRTSRLQECPLDMNLSKLHSSAAAY